MLQNLISVLVNTMNKYLFELLRRIEEGARRLASTITHNIDKRLRDISLVDVMLGAQSERLGMASGWYQICGRQHRPRLVGVIAQAGRESNGDMGGSSRSGYESS